MKYTSEDINRWLSNYEDDASIPTHIVRDLVNIVSDMEKRLKRMESLLRDVKGIAPCLV